MRIQTRSRRKSKQREVPPFIPIPTFASEVMSTVNTIILCLSRWRNIPSHHPGSGTKKKHKGFPVWCYGISKIWRLQTRGSTLFSYPNFRQTQYSSSDWGHVYYYYKQFSVFYPIIRNPEQNSTRGFRLVLRDVQKTTVTNWCYQNDGVRSTTQHYLNTTIISTTTTVTTIILLLYVLLYCCTRSEVGQSLIRGTHTRRCNT